MTLAPGIAHKHSLGFKCGWFHDPCWSASIHLIWPVTPRDLDAYIKHEFDITFDAGKNQFGGRCLEVIPLSGGPRVNIIALHRWENSPAGIGILAHEVFHATEHILAERGVVLTVDTTEPYAYLLQSIMSRSLEILRPPRKRVTSIPRK